MGTNSNGSTPKKFGQGLVVPESGVTDSPLWHTGPGRAFIGECLDRHSEGDWGELPSWLALTSQRFASDEGIASGGLVAGIYWIPEALRLDPEDDRLIVVTTTLAPIVDIPELRIVVTVLLLVSDLP